MFARPPFLALLACPRCSAALRAVAGGDDEALECPSCDARFGVAGGVADLRRSADPRTDAVRRFYSGAPFPNYPPGDTFPGLRARAARSEVARLLDAAIPPDACVLEVGCGTGQMSLYLASGDRTVVGADLTRASLELGADAARRYGVEQVRFVETDLHAPGLAAGAFDVVYASGVLHHTPSPRAAFAAIVPLARPGGWIVLGLYNSYARFPHRVRRAVARLTRLRVVPFDPVLRSRASEPARREAWLRDQYLHPEEHRHTIAEVKGWFRDHGVEYVRSYPNPNIGAAAIRDGDLFAAAEDDWCPENVAAQLTWAATLAHEGGLWIMVGRRTEAPVRKAGGRAAGRRAAYVAMTASALGLAVCAWRANRAWWEGHVPVLCCFTSPWEIAAADTARAALVAAGAALVLVASPRLAHWTRADARRALGAAARVLLSVGLAILVSELVLQAARKPVTKDDDVPAVRPDDHLGRTLVPATTSETLRGGRRVSFAIDAMGLRSESADDVPDLARPTVLVAGESIALGYAVPYDESPAYLLERATGLPVLNASVSAYANDQVYRHMRQILDRLERPLAVVTFVVPLQIERDVDYRREHLALDSRGVLTVVPPASTFIRRMVLFDVLDRLGPHSERAFDVARAIVEATARDVRARGAFPLFVATNFRQRCLHDESGESSLAHRLFAGLGVAHVSVDLDPAWAVPGDGHPDVRGSRALATAIAAALQDAGVR